MKSSNSDSLLPVQCNPGKQRQYLTEEGWRFLEALPQGDEDFIPGASTCLSKWTADVLKWY